MWRSVTNFFGGPDIQVAPITSSEARNAITSWHYLGTKPFRCQLAVGLWEDNALLGAAVFHGLSAPETAVGAFGLSRQDQAGLWELGRFVLAPECNGHNTGTWFLARAIKILRQRPCRALITYASADRHYGALYQAASFTYCGLTAAKSDFWVGGHIQERGKTKGVEGVWLPRPRKHRYIKVWDRKLILRWPVQPYPKEAG